MLVRPTAATDRPASPAVRAGATTPRLTAGRNRTRRKGWRVYPEDLKYTAEHEWLRPVGEGGDAVARIGITSYAQDALGDIVFVTLPAVGAEITAGQAIGEVESTKSVSDVYAPFAGTVTAVNEALESAPELVNSDPYGDGWMFEVRPADGLQEALDADTLLDASAYEQRVSA
jgi:glycine cleavage system H protein